MRSPCCAAPTPNRVWSGRIGPCSPRSSCQPSHPRPSPSRRQPDRSPPRVPGRSSWADATSGAWAATTSDRPVRQARSGVAGHPQRRRGQTRLGDKHGVAQPTTDHHIAGRVHGVRKAEILDRIAVAVRAQSPGALDNHSKCAMRPSASARTLRVDRNLTVDRHAGAWDASGMSGNRPPPRRVFLSHAGDQQVVRERGHRTSVRAALSS
jgi:hypothetical protein